MIDRGSQTRKEDRERGLSFFFAEILFSLADGQNKKSPSLLFVSLSLSGWMGGLKREERGEDGTDFPLSILFPRGLLSGKADFTLLLLLPFFCLCFKSFYRAGGEKGSF